MDALNESHHAPKNSVTQVDAWQTKTAWEHLAPLLSACDAIAFDALNAPRVLPARSPEPEFVVPRVEVTTAVAAFQRTITEHDDEWESIDLQECYAVRVRRNFDWLPKYVNGGDVLLVSRGAPNDTNGRLLFARHLKAGPNSSVAMNLGFGGKSEGKLTLWGVGSKTTTLEPPYEIDTVRGILYSPPDVYGEGGFVSLKPDEVDLSEFKAAPIVGESAEPFARSGDHVLIRENDRIEEGQPLVDHQLYLVETSDGGIYLKRFDRHPIGVYERLLFQPVGQSLGGSGITILARWARGDGEEQRTNNAISGVWPVRGILFAA